MEDRGRKVEKDAVAGSGWRRERKREERRGGERAEAKGGESAGVVSVGAAKGAAMPFQKRGKGSPAAGGQSDTVMCCKTGTDSSGIGVCRWELVIERCHVCLIGVD